MQVILRKPVVSEKSMQQTKSNLFTFLVDRRATKPEIARAVRLQFGVDVLSVATANFKEEKRALRARRGHFTVAGFKKAMVQLKDGQKISLFEGESDAEAAVGNEEKTEVKEKKSLLKGTKVKIEKNDIEKKPTKKEKKDK